jgi:hypothetical protein
MVLTQFIILVGIMFIRNYKMIVICILPFCSFRLHLLAIVLDGGAAGGVPQVVMRQGLAVLLRLALNSRAQAIFLPHPPK